MPHPAASARLLRLLLAAGILVLLGIVAFLVTVNRTSVTSIARRPATPSASAVPVPSPTLSLGDIARAQLGQTVTVEALGPTDEGLGTGWLFDTKGDFVTNAHVIQGQVTVRLRGRDGSSHVGDVVGVDTLADVALVRSHDGFSGTPFALVSVSFTTFPQPVVVIASSRATGHGDITEERASRIEPSVPVTGDTTTGQPPTTTVYDDMLVLDGAAVYPGNSGGPVLNRDGAVVGILTLASKSAPEAYAIQLTRVIAELRDFAAK